MTKQQKREVQLQKEIRLLERDNFVLRKEIDRLKHELKVSNVKNRTLNDSLETAISKLQDVTGKLDLALEVRNVE